MPFFLRISISCISNDIGDDSGSIGEQTQVAPSRRKAKLPVCQTERANKLADISGSLEESKEQLLFDTTPVTK